MNLVSWLLIGMLIGQSGKVQNETVGVGNHSSTFYPPIINQFCDKLHTF